MMNFTTQLETIASHRFSKTFSQLTKKEQYAVVANLVNDLAADKMKDTQAAIVAGKNKEVYYFSMEFLMGRLLLNNVENMGIYDALQGALSAYDIAIKDLEFEELDAGLGNGGLGRLAACFMDSIASLDYAGHGVTIRYRNGFFKQEFKNDEQVELPDLWLRNRNEWENQIIEDAVTIRFYGKVKHDTVDGKKISTLVDTLDVLAMPYDMPIVGKKFNTVNRLRMYDVCPLESGFTLPHYENDVMEIASCLYPDDSTTKGKELRLKQQYVFVSAGIQNIMKQHLARYGTLDNLSDYVVMQINDTHPVLLVPEMLRLLMDEHGYTYDTAMAIVKKSVAYTNHTILAEALEKWDVKLVKKLLPRIYELIELVNANFVKELHALGYTEAAIEAISIIKDKKVHMAHLAVYASFSVNGVAALHTEILKESTLADWHTLYPNKINNKTNGITQRRWFEYCNPALTSWLQKHAKIEDDSNPIAYFEQFMSYQHDADFIRELAAIKLQNKRELIEYIAIKEAVNLDENAIFDIQIKRLHAYKRQLLNVIHIIYLYQKMKSDRSFYEAFYPQTFIFGAKAAPSYVFAKNVIKLIKKLQNIILADPEVNAKLKVVMVTNYNVSYAEKLIPAADISEQISTAGFEASGTGNMKFMMNGAITIGTMDGANVEIHELVGDDNIEIFGLLKDEVNKIHDEKSYHAKKFCKEHAELTKVFTFIEKLNVDGDFDPILNDIFKDNDYYLVLKDFDAYKQAQANMNALYKDKAAWGQKALINIAKSGFFSSDRTIRDYVNDIWHIEPIQTK